MNGFLKEFLDGGKTAEEQALLATQQKEKQHDVLTVDLDAFTDAGCDDEDDAAGCDVPSGGCGGCGCRS